MIRTSLHGPVQVGDYCLTVVTQTCVDACGSARTAWLQGSKRAMALIVESKTATYGIDLSGRRFDIEQWGERFADRP